MGRTNRTSPGAPPQLERRPSAQAFQLDDLLALVADGAVRIPRFQRGLRWDDGDRLALFDSIYRGYPIGTLLLWKRDAEAARVTLGRFSIDAPARHGAHFVVDGQQRLTALAETLLSATESTRPMVFDLSERSFEYLPSRPLGRSDSARLPLSVTLDANSLLEWLFAHPELGREQRSAAVEVGKRIREYQLPAYVVETADESVLRTIFQRINQTGRRLEADEVFHALFGSFAHEAPSSLAELAEGLLPLAFGKLEEGDLLKALLAIRGIPLDRDFTSELSESEIPAAIQQTDRAIRASVVFLRKDSGVHHVELLPYALPLVVLSAFFARFPTPSVRSRILLRRWLWRASLSERLTGATVGTRQHLACLQAGQEEASVQGLLALAGRAPSPDIEDPSAFQFNTARTKLQCCALASLAPRALSGELLDFDAVLGATSPTSTHPSPRGEPARERLPRVVPPSQSSASGARGLANRLLHPYLPPGELRRALVAADPATLASHGITETARQALEGEDFDAFLTLREERLRDVLRDVFAVRAEWGADDSPSLASMIIDEDAA